MIKNKLISPRDLVPILQNVTIFAGFNKDDIVKICESCSIIEAQSGDVLLLENTSANEILIILSGFVKIVLNLKADPVELIEFGPGDCVGEASVIGIQNHIASAVVKEDATILVLSRSVLMTLFETDKNLFSLLILNMARELARRLHHTDKMLLKYERYEKNGRNEPMLKKMPSQEGLLRSE